MDSSMSQVFGAKLDRKQKMINVLHFAVLSVLCIYYHTVFQTLRWSFC